MARSRITAANKSLTNDDGSIIQSLIAGEQLRTQVTLNFFTNINGCKLRARVVEADNSNLNYTNGVPISYPTSVKNGAQVQSLPIRFQTDSDSYSIVDPDEDDYVTIRHSNTNFVSNSFEIIWDADIVEGFDPLPQPDQPVYAFFGLEVVDTGSGKAQQVYKPMRGLIELRYSANPFDF